MNSKEILESLQNGSEKFEKKMPEQMEKFWAFANSVKEEGKLSKKEKTLIAIAAVTAKHCESCIVRNLQDAIDIGITKDELAELCCVLMLMDGGPGFSHGVFLLEKYDELINSN